MGVELNIKSYEIEKVDFLIHMNNKNKYDCNMKKKNKNLIKLFGVKNTYEFPMKL